MDLGGPVSIRDKLPIIGISVLLVIGLAFLFSIFLRPAPSKLTDWETIIIDCKKPIQEPDNPDPFWAGVNLEGDVFWKEKTGMSFTITNFRDRITGKPSSPFRHPTGLEKKEVDGKRGRSDGDRAKKAGKYKYDIICGNGKKYDPGVDVPRM
jgi:hypothetical protein